jgi:hypothetical protein
LAKLYQAGLLVERENLALQRSLGRNQARLWAMGLTNVAKSWRRLSFTMPNADRLCATLYRYGGFLLFHWVTLWVTVIIALLAGAAAIHLSPQAKQFTQTLSIKPWLSTGVMLASLLAVSMMHVTVHALACKAYNRGVREIGFFLLQGVLPTFYADVTDIFMSTRRARVIVDLAGPLVELFAAARFSRRLSGDPVSASALFGVVLLWEGALINLTRLTFSNWTATTSSPI